jgi:hypothetical protein
MQGLYRLVCAAIVLAAPAGDAAGEAGRGALREVSDKVVALYNRDDAAALHAMLAPDLRHGWPVEQLAARLGDCRQRLGTLERVSPPVMGTRTFGFIAAYFDTAVRDMFLEIDEDGFIRMLAFKGQSDLCSLSRP